MIRWCNRPLRNTSRRRYTLKGKIPV